MTRIWFNHWFTSVYFIMDLIREDTSREYYILASNDKDNAVVAKKADEWFKEHYIEDGDKYVNYCLQVCLEKNIDLFIPRRHRDAISKRAADFDKIGVKLLVNKNYSSNELLNNKVKTYEEMSKDADLKKLVPQYISVDEGRQFENACLLTQFYSERIGDGKICMKFAEDEGASSFKVLVRDEKDLDFTSHNQLTYKMARTLLSRDGSKFKKSVMVMPYLSEEVSCDCLRVGSKIICVVRSKTGVNRCHLIKHDAELYRYCSALIDKFDISGPCNIQFRKENKQWKLLDINTRMSGGVQLSSMGSGINIPSIAVRDVLGDEDIRWTYKNEYMTAGVRMFNLETPYFVERNH